MTKLTRTEVFAAVRKMKAAKWEECFTCMNDSGTGGIVFQSPKDSAVFFTLNADTINNLPEGV